MRRHKKRVNLHLDIAPINLIDLLLVLLIFFVTTTSFLQLKTIELSLPKSESTKSTYKKNQTVVINIDKQCQIFVDKKLTDEQNLTQKLQSLKSEKPQRIFQVGADKESAHRCFVTVLDALMQAEISNISILTKEKK